METIILQNNIQVVSVKADVFPTGIMAAYEALAKALPAEPHRVHYGLSHGTETGEIVYYAAAEQLADGDAEQYNLQPLTIPAGTYASITIQNFMQNLPAVSTAFQTLLALPNHHKNGMCIEHYINQHDVACMIRITE
ncbi:MAG: effector binding domain-containing protein [Candidatus Kapaibacterium sp.]